MARHTDSFAVHHFDGRLIASLVAMAISGAGLAAGALIVFGLRAGLSVAAGAGIATANLWALARTVVAWLPGGAAPAPSNSPEAGSPSTWALVGLLKMTGLLVAIGSLLHYQLVSPLAMLVGFGALPIGIAIGAVVSDRGNVDDPPERRL